MASDEDVYIGAVGTKVTLRSQAEGWEGGRTPGSVIIISCVLMDSAYSPLAGSHTHAMLY